MLAQGTPIYLRTHADCGLTAAWSVSEERVQEFFALLAARVKLECRTSWNRFEKKQRLMESEHKSSSAEQAKENTEDKSSVLRGHSPSRADIYIYI